MTSENWIMISPALVLIVIAIVLIPFVNRANAKFSRMAHDVRQAKSRPEKDTSFAHNLSKLEAQTNRLTGAIEALSRKFEEAGAKDTATRPFKRRFAKNKDVASRSLDLTDHLFSATTSPAASLAELESLLDSQRDKPAVFVKPIIPNFGKESN
ncbi:hypothetical protein R0J87_15740 [Halomonas sp. SIMBA_159]